MSGAFKEANTEHLGYKISTKVKSLVELYY